VYTPRPRFLVLGVFVLLALAAPVPASAQQHLPGDDDLRHMLRYLVEDGEAPGVVLGVLDPDGSTRVVAYGSSGPEGRSVGPRSVFEIGSITKTFTATLLADMVLRGEVALDDPASRYLPDHVAMPSFEGREITLLDLALHRSALPTTPTDLGNIGRRNTGVSYTVEDAYAFLSDYALPRAPGSRFEYSNFGYGLLGHVLGRAAGSSYRELVGARILAPLGMEQTTFDAAEAGDWMTTGHRGGDPVRYRTDLEIFDGAGGLRSTAADLLKYMAAHVGEPRTDLERATRFAIEVRDTVSQGGAGRGLAWGTVVHPGQAPVIAHGGGTVGYSSMLTVMTDRATGLVLLANDAAFDDNLALTLLYPDPPPAEWERVSVDPAVLGRYVGEYRTTSGSKSFIRLEGDGALTYQPDGRVRARLYPTSDTTFYMLRSAWSFTFRPGEDDGMEMVMAVDQREPRDEGRVRVARRVGNSAPPPARVAGNVGRLEGSVTQWALLALAVLVTGAALGALRRLRVRRRHVAH
jgi:serine-type D-Ala-D-Ala carboxypeptidase/endopeptidase